MGRGEAWYVIALRAAQQLVDWDTETPRHDVVQRDVDRGDGTREDAAALEVLAAVHLLPECAYATGVLADEELSVVLDGALDGQLSTYKA